VPEQMMPAVWEIRCSAGLMNCEANELDYILFSEFVGGSRSR
jgi:hypothetical protein